MTEDKQKQKQWYDIENADSDVIVKLGPLRLYYQNYYTIISLSLDILVGILYFVGAILFLFESTTQLGTYLFVIGGFFFFARPVIKLIDNFRHYALSYEKRERDEDYFDDDHFFEVKHSDDQPLTNDSSNCLGEEYYNEYYD